MDLCTQGLGDAAKHGKGMTLVGWRLQAADLLLRSADAFGQLFLRQALLFAQCRLLKCRFQKPARPFDVRQHGREAVGNRVCGEDPFAHCVRTHVARASCPCFMGGTPMPRRFCKGLDLIEIRGWLTYSSADNMWYTSQQSVIRAFDGVLGKVADGVSFGGVCEAVNDGRKTG